MGKKKTADSVFAADTAVAKLARRYQDTPPVQALEYVGDLGDQPPLRILCGAAIGLGLVAGNRRLLRAGVAMLAAHTLATFAKDAVKERVDRTRPHAAGKPGKDAKPRKGDNEAKQETSFPSGHSAGAAAVARAFARAYPEHAGKAYAAAGFLALAQIPRCAHYPTDVGAGLAIGIAAEAVTGAVLKRV